MTLVVDVGMTIVDVGMTSRIYWKLFFPRFRAAMYVFAYTDANRSQLRSSIDFDLARKELRKLFKHDQKKAVRLVKMAIMRYCK